MYIVIYSDIHPHLQSPEGGLATDAMDTCPMTNSQVEMAAQHMGSLPSPIPSKSPELTADDRRAQYQNTGPRPNPNSASPASDCPVHGSPGVKSAATSSKDEAVGGVTVLKEVCTIYT